MQNSFVIGRKHLALVCMSILLAIVLASALISRTWRPSQIGELEQTLAEYRLAGDLAPPEGLAASIVPPVPFPMEVLEAFGELYLWNCLQEVNRISGRHLKGIVFNGPVSADFVNIYLVQRDPHNVFAGFRNNCAYVGGDNNLIICDAAYVNGLQHEPQWLKDLRTRRQDREFDEQFPNHKSWPEGSAESSKEWAEIIGDLGRVNNRQVIIWVLAHEMGHLAYDHRDRHFVFSGEPNDLLIRNFDSRFSQEELEADQFAVQAVGDKFQAEPLRTGLETAVDRFGSMLLVGEGHSDDLWGTDDKILVKRDSDTHPPLFLRAVNLLIDLDKAYAKGNPEKIEDLKRRVVIIE